jgi:hypothetical protein
MLIWLGKKHADWDDARIASAKSRTTSNSVVPKGSSASDPLELDIEKRAAIQRLK